MRNCNGGNGPDAKWCGKPATVVVSAFVNGPRFPMQWFACDDPEHHRYEQPGLMAPMVKCETKTEPLTDWLKKNGLYDVEPS